MIGALSIRWKGEESGVEKEAEPKEGCPAETWQGSAKGTSS